jgi:hypothetical protein
MTAINDKIQSRLGELRADYERGRLQLQGLTEQEVHLRETLLRISGAIQALEEVVSTVSADTPEPTNGVVSGTAVTVP